ncbi:nitroreductase family protein [Streptomyces chartreusis]|uniref:nitroreductase family protein n=1 Tax=Streptomyces chartreusis TaxID=1969 RepID=UPI0036CB4D7D
MLQLSARELLTTTRSVRKRLDLHRSVDLELVKDALHDALQAPSGSNAQRWHFVVVTDADRRREIGSLYRSAVHQYLNSPGSAANLFSEHPELNTVQQRVGSSVAYLGEVMGQVPVLVIPCLELPDGLPDGNQAGTWGSVLPAAWSYMLAARLRGLGTAWTTLHLTYEAEVANILGLPSNMYQGALIPTAHTIGTTFRPANRRRLNEVLHVDSWT